jgi:hypothetical protein
MFINTKNGAYHLFFFLVIRPVLNWVLLVILLVLSVFVSLF